MNVLGWLKIAGKKTLTVVEQVPHAMVIVTKLLFTGTQVAPEVRTAVTKIVSACEEGSLPILAAIAARGDNWGEDVAALAGAKLIAQTFQAEWPVAVDVFEKIDADVKGVVSAPAPVA